MTSASTQPRSPHARREPIALKNRRVRDYALTALGVLIAAWALDAFLIPNRIAAGGVSGLATVVHHVSEQAFGYAPPVGVQMLAMNAVLLFIAFRVAGLGYAAKTVAGTVGLSIAIDLLAPVTPVLAGDDLLLAALYGGAIAGLGLGLVFKAGANTGGTDIIAQLLSRRYPFGVGHIMLAVDAAVTVIAALAFGPKLALYGAVAIVTTSAAINLVLEGVSVEKAVWIISDHAETIGDAVISDLRRGATAIQATGVYTGQPRGMLFVVLSRNELDGLKSVVGSIDPKALVIVSDVHEAIGEGFREMGS